MNDEHSMLRDELTRRGVEWSDDDGRTSFADDRGYQCMAFEVPEVSADRLVLGFASLSAEEALDLALGDEPIDPASDVEALDLEARVTNALHRGGVHTVGDLMAVGDLTSIRGIGQLTARDIRHALEGAA